ncbi:hypothetical protein BH18CHL1_BH18CHL1_10250 [soil metagenome]
MRPPISYSEVVRVAELEREAPGSERAAVSDAAPSTASRLTSGLVELATTAILAIVIYLVVQTFVVQTYRVEMQSMVPSLDDGQHLLIDKLTPRFDDYSRGDVVVFQPPGSRRDETPFIKRVIGTAGDHVEISGGGVVVNGVRLEEGYVASDGPTVPSCGDSAWNVPAGEIFVLGDHRSASRDSRCFGTVRVGNVIGRAWVRFWPLDGLSILPTPTYAGVPPAG